MFMKAKYAASKHRIFATPKLYYSDTWNRISKVKVHAENKMHWVIGRGEINFWFDSWFNNAPLYTLASREITYPSISVAQGLADTSLW
jgi:hypothetical protein